MDCFSCRWRYDRKVEMEYLDLIAKWEPERAALFIDGNCITYGKLVKMVMDKRKTGNEKEVFYPILKSGVLEQLVCFLAFSGTRQIPVIVEEGNQKAQFALLQGIKARDIPKGCCMAVFTSGTTGEAKLLYRDYKSWAGYFPVQNEIFHIWENTKIFMHGSLYFTGNLNLYLSVLYAGGTIYTISQFAPDLWKNCIQRECNMIYLVPTKLEALTKVLKTEKNERVKMIVSGSQSMGRSEAQNLKNIFINTDIVLYYGASELNYVSYVSFKDMTEEKNLIGRVFPQVEVTLREGEIYVNTPYGVQGLAMPYSVGDLGSMDSQGNLYFMGRKDDRYSIHEEKVYGTVVEEALCKIEGIREAAVVCRGGQLQAHIVSDKIYGRRELVGQLSAMLRSVEIPKKFMYHQYFQKNEGGKINKKKL